jgi:hypothetical protein
MPETKLALAETATPSQATNNDEYLLCTAQCNANRHTNHVLLHRESQRLASHSKPHRQHDIMNSRRKCWHNGCKRRNADAPPDKKRKMVLLH